MGSFNIEDGRILLNLELAKKPLPYLEYIIVHELLHSKERQHSDRFKALLDTHISDWKSIRDLLNRMPVGQEDCSSVMVASMLVLSLVPEPIP